MSTSKTFDFTDFHFTVLSPKTCTIGINNNQHTNAPLSGSGLSGVLIIPEYAYDDETGNRYEVVETSKYCFRCCSNIVAAQFPRTLKKIGQYTFYGAGITSLIIPRSVEILDYAAFSAMEKLNSLVFEPGSKLSIIGEIVMNGFNKIRKVVLPPHVASIASQFSGMFLQQRRLKCIIVK